MTAACLALGTLLLPLADLVVTLSWTHSVERVQWVETWKVGATDLTLLRSALKGSGAGMEPGPDARLEEGWWITTAEMSVPRLVLAASGATVSAWQLCADGACRELGGSAGDPITLAPCEEAATQDGDGVPDM